MEIITKFINCIQANCIDSTVPAEAVFASEVKKLQAEQFKPAEQVTLEPFERDHACVVGAYRMPKKAKSTAQEPILAQIHYAEEQNLYFMFSDILYGAMDVELLCTLRILSVEIVNFEYLVS